MSNQELPAKLIPDDGRPPLKEMFDPMPDTVEVHVYAEDGDENVLTRFCRQIAGELGECSAKVRAVQHGSADSRALPGMPERPLIGVKKAGAANFVLQMVGAPLGHEGTALIRAITLAGSGKAELSKGALAALDKLRDKRVIKVFGTGT